MAEPKKDEAKDQGAPEGDTLVIEGTLESPAPEGNGQTTVEPPSGRTFTEDDIQKARREEKDKLYSSIDEMKKELAAFRKAEEERQKAEQAAAKKAEEERAKQEAEAKKRAEEEMTAKQLLEQKEQEWEQRWRTLEEENQRKDEILAKERRYNELMSYRSRRLEEEADTIAPQLRDLVVLGNSEQEIEASIADLQERTNRILEQIQAGREEARRNTRTTSATAPPVGPMETQQEFQSLSNTDLKGMDMQTYAKNRERLLGAVSQRVRERGLYGA